MAEECQGTDQMAQTESIAHIELASTLASSQATTQNPKIRCDRPREQDHTAMSSPLADDPGTTLVDELDAPREAKSPHADSVIASLAPEGSPHAGTQPGELTEVILNPDEEQDQPQQERGAYIQSMEDSSPHEPRELADRDPDQLEPEEEYLATLGDSDDTLCIGDDQLDYLPASSPPPSSSPIRLFLSSIPASPPSPSDDCCNMLQIDLEEVNAVLSGETTIDFPEGPSPENTNGDKERYEDRDNTAGTSPGLCDLASGERPVRAPLIATEENIKIEEKSDVAMIPMTIQEPVTPLKTAKRKALEVPNPKRPTLAMQKSEHKKLIKPFKTPARVPDTERMETKSLPITPSRIEATAVLKKKTLAKPSTSNDTHAKYRTAKAAGQFKSPLTATASSDVLLGVRFTPTVQGLERRLQALKRAVRIKQEGDEATLQGLIKKWTEAGREVAWEVWNLVKDNVTEDGPWAVDKGKRVFQESWGWDGQGENKKPCLEQDEPDAGAESEGRQNDADEGVQKKQDTLGTMLVQLGIDPSTLGWNEEEGDFDVEILD